MWALSYTFSMLFADEDNQKIGSDTYSHGICEKIDPKEFLWDDYLRS